MTSPVKLPPLPSAIDTVRALFRGQPDYFQAQDSYYTQDQMRAYAEQAVRQALEDKAPVVGEAQKPIGFVDPVYVAGRQRGMPWNAKIYDAPNQEATAPLYAAPQASVPTKENSNGEPS